MTSNLQTEMPPVEAKPPTVSPASDTAGPAATADAAGNQAQAPGVADEERTWWFRFTPGSPYAGRYAVTYGTHDAAWAEVVRHFGEAGVVGPLASAVAAGVAAGSSVRGAVSASGLMRLRRDQWPPAAAGEPLAEAPLRLPNLPTDVLDCDRPATNRFEVYGAADGHLYGELAGTVNTCETHAEAVAAVAVAAGFRVLPRPGDVGHQRCGSGLAFAGERPETWRVRAGRAVEQPDDGEVPQEHFHVSGSVGGPGECSAVRACALVFDGFDTLAEAVAVLDRHIADPEPVYRVVLPDVFHYANRELTIPAPHTADEIATVIHAELVSVGYNGREIEVSVDLAAGTAQISWGGPHDATITGPGVGTAPAGPEPAADAAAQQLMADSAAVASAVLEYVDDVTRQDIWPDGYRQPAADTAAGEPAATASEPVRVPASQLEPGMYVATGVARTPGALVRHVEPSDDGAEPIVGVLMAGPTYAEYHGRTLVEVVDKSVVDAAAARMRVRVHRAMQIDALRELADLAEADEHFPLPPFSLIIDGPLDSPAAVRRFAAAVEVPVTEDGYGVRAVWHYGRDLDSPPVKVEMHAPHPYRSRPAVGRQAVTEPTAVPDAIAPGGDVDQAVRDEPIPGGAR